MVQVLRLEPPVPLVVESAGPELAPAEIEDARAARTGARMTSQYIRSPAARRRPSLDDAAGIGQHLVAEIES